jgi:hypothetical protein
MAQGFWFSKPLAPASARALLLREMGGSHPLANPQLN